MVHFEKSKVSLVGTCLVLLYATAPVIISLTQTGNGTFGAIFSSNAGFSPLDSTIFRVSFSNFAGSFPTPLAIYSVIYGELFNSTGCFNFFSLLGATLISQKFSFPRYTLPHKLALHYIQYIFTIHIIQHHLLSTIP